MYGSNAASQGVSGSYLGGISISGNLTEAPQPAVLDGALVRVQQILSLARSERARIREFADAILGSRPEPVGPANQASPPPCPRGESLLRALDDLSYEVDRIRVEADRLGGI